MAEQELMDVKFANGNVLKNVPVGTSREVILDKAMNAGIITSMDQTPGGKTAGEKLRDFSLENIDIPAGFAGSYAGAKAAGLATGGNPYAILAGGIVGGAGATYGAESLEDFLQSEEIDHYNATKQSLISAGIETSVLLATKGIGRPLVNLIKRNTSLGKSADETAKELLESAPMGEAVAGSEESIRASQALLADKDATLTPFQATPGQDKALTQRIADTGILSQGIGQRNYDRVNEAVQEHFDELLAGVGREGIQPSVLGEELYSVINSGRQAAFKAYDQGMNDVISVVGKSRLSTNGFKRQVERFIKSNQEGGAKRGFNMLQEDTQKFARSVIEDLDRMKNMSASTLINYEKKLMKEMNKFSELGGNSYNSEAARELAQLSDLIRTAVQRELQRINPTAAAEYAAVKRAYGETIEGILPTNLKNIVANAKQGEYAALGQIAASSGSLDKLNSMMKSIKTSHAEIVKAGGKPPIPLDEAMEKLQEGYLRQLIPDLGTEAFDIQTYKKLAARFERGRDAEKLKLIFGNKEPKIRQLFNLMSEASQFPTSNIGELMLRSKEYKAVGQVAGVAGSVVSATGGTLAGGATGGLVGGAAILTLPIFLAKAAYKPSNVNRLIAFQSKNFASRDAMIAAAGNLVTDIMRSLPEEDQAEVRNYIRRQDEVTKEKQAEQVSAPMRNMVM
jgi:hypothetical protein